MPGKEALMNWNLQSKYEIPDFEEAFNYADLKNFYGTKEMKSDFCFENGGEKMEQEDFKSKSFDSQDMLSYFNQLDMDNTRPNTPMDKSLTLHSTPFQELTMLNTKRCFLNENELANTLYENTDMEYMNDFWLNVEEEEENDDKSFVKLGENSNNILNIDIEKKEEEKQLAKPMKQIFTIIRMAPQKKVKKCVRVNRSHKLKNKSVFKKKNQITLKENKLNDIIPDIGKVKRKRIKK